MSLKIWNLLSTLSGTFLESETREGVSRDNIDKVKEDVIPFLKSTYVEKLVSTVAADIKRWNKTFFEQNILNNSFGKNEVEHTFAFLTFETYSNTRNDLYGRTEEFPLLRYRVYFLNAQLKNTKGIKSLIYAHTQRVGWQLHRIYRARNYIIHDGTRNDSMNHELVINLHSYIDTMFLKVFSMMSLSPNRDSMQNIIISHKLAVSIMYEKLEQQGKISIDESNALKFLYYDFER